MIKMHIYLSGDSLIARHEGYQQPILNHLLKEKDASITITNTAVPGINSQQFLQQYNKLGPNQNFDYLVVLLGTNDLATHKQISLEQFKININEIITRLLKKYHSQQIILVSPPPVDENKQQFRTNHLVLTYSKILEEECIAYNLKFLSLYQLLSNQEVPATQLLQGTLDDGLHFGESAYTIFSDALYELFVDGTY